MMSETVQIALITLVSGFIGAVIGAISTYIVSKVGANAERAKLLHDEKRLAYSELMAAHDNIVVYFTDVFAKRKQLREAPYRDIFEQFHRATSAARLIAPEEVQKAIDGAIKEFQHLANGGEIPEFPDEFEVLTKAMHDDLLSFNHRATNRRGIKARTKSLFRPKASAST